MPNQRKGGVGNSRQLMANGGLMRKKTSKRSPKPQHSPIPSPPSTSSHLFNYRNILMAISVVLIVFVVALSSVSSNTWARFQSDSCRDNLYAIEVVNEFPHDPQAFTQVKSSSTYLISAFLDIYTFKSIIDLV